MKFPNTEQKGSMDHSENVGDNYNGYNHVTFYESNKISSTTNHDRNRMLILRKNSGTYRLAILAFVICSLFSFFMGVDGLIRPFVRNVSEDVPVGYVLLQLQAYVKTPGDLTNITYIINHDSDINRMFSIGDNDGILRVAKPLDREDTPSYRLILEAIDDAENEAEAVLFIYVEDVNDNSPYLNLKNQHYILWENMPAPQFIGRVTAYDRDGAGNGPPFFMQQAANSSYLNVIKVDFNQLADGGNGAINVTSIIAVDREGANGKFFYVPILILDTRNLDAIRYLPIEIGDINDNKMTDGYSSILIYNFEGNMPETIIGRVYVTDLDDWDVVDKTFTFSGSCAIPPYFKLLEDGLIAMVAGTPKGTYTLCFDVVDNSKTPVEEATGTVNVVVEYISQQDIDFSCSVRIRDISADAFIKPFSGTPSRYDRFRSSLATCFNVDVEAIKIFSVKNVPGEIFPPIIDVYFAIIDFTSSVSGTFLSPILLSGVIEQKRMEMEATFDLSMGQIIQVNIDPCILVECAEGGCTRLLNVNATPAVIMTNMTSLIGVNINVTSECQCPRPVATLQCQQDSCYNGGICHNTTMGYFCECRGSYNNGSRCEGRTRKFHANSFAWLKPIVLCENFSISLEFMTKSANATLLYNGPMQNGRPWDIFNPDFIAIYIINGRLVVQVNLGAGETRFPFTTASPLVNDGNWHTIDIVASSRDFEIILDHCSNITAESAPSNITALDVCRIKGVASGTNQQLNVDDPLQLGGFSPVDGAAFNQTLISDSLVGCVRNLIVNGELYDLTGVVNENNTEVGCGLTDPYCQANGLDICVHGECVASMFGTMKCVCNIGWCGLYCDQGTVNSTTYFINATSNVSITVDKQETLKSLIKYQINMTTFDGKVFQFLDNPTYSNRNLTATIYIRVTGEPLVQQEIDAYTYFIQKYIATFWNVNTGTNLNVTVTKVASSQ